MTEPANPEESVKRVRSLDATRERWRYLPRLFRMLWTLSPGGMAIVAVTGLFVGLLPLASLAVLRHLVEFLTISVHSRAAMWPALGWTVALVLTVTLQRTIGKLVFLMRDQIQERLKAQIQELLIAKAQAVPLAIFEQPKFYDQLQRVERGVDNRLFSTIIMSLHSGRWSFIWAERMAFCL
jgi:ABC-type multidrug transport system fused ATPase/permease subunit